MAKKAKKLDPAVKDAREAQLRQSIEAERKAAEAEGAKACDPKVIAAMTEKLRAAAEGKPADSDEAKDLAAWLEDHPG